MPNRRDGSTLLGRRPAADVRGRALIRRPSPRCGQCQPSAALEVFREAYVPTKQPEAVSPSRVPSSYVRPCWSCSGQISPPQRSQAPERLIARCRARSDFRRLDDEGRRRAARHIWVRSVIDDEVRPPRVAFAVGRRNGNAVTRNRIKRRLRAAIEQRAGEIPAGIHLVGWKRAASKRTRNPGLSSEPSFDEILEDIDKTLVGGHVVGPEGR